MKLNAPVRLPGSKKREAYPTKRSMNLYFHNDRASASATLFLYVLFAVVVALALCKVLLYDPITRTAQLESQALSLEAQADAQLAQLKDYNQIREDYLRIAPTQEETEQVDRMEILALVDRVIRPAASLTQISISDNKVLLTFSGVTLEGAAGLVTQLEQSPLVTAASVDTAVSEQEDETLSEIHVYFEVAPEKEANP